ncbi:MAG: 2-hydroxyacid dehydrogenase [Lachnospiraceae bacterium]|nr:2-hydroxyacid dehydrogenase [Lachnospiraceae bacterium]
MKVVGIGDLLIPSQYIEKGFAPLRDLGCEVETVSWELKDYEELQHINLLVEQNGAEEYQVPDYIVEAVKDADIVITQFCTVTKALIDSCTKLKAVGVLRAGVENINVKYASEKGILVFNTPGRNATAVADFTVGMLLSECRNIAKSHYNLKEGKWVRDYSNAAYVPDLEGKTAGIIGYGNIGQKVAARLRAFGMNIIAFDPYYHGEDVRLVELPELMKESDFVLVHYRLTEETKHLINRELLEMMKPTAYLINTARSGLVDEEALVEVLNGHKIYGAAIDVFELEPPGKDYPLVRCDNVTITPHLAGGTKDAFLNSPVHLANDMRKLFEGGECRFILNKASCGDNELLKEN